MSEVQCTIGNGHMAPFHEQTDTTEKITFLQLRWREVKKLFRSMLSRSHELRAAQKSANLSHTIWIVSLPKNPKL